MFFNYIFSSSQNNSSIVLETEPAIGACSDVADCSNNGGCVNNYCECNPGFDFADNPKDCSSKFE